MARFNDIPTVDRRYPKVGIVGEIYVKYNSFSNNHVAHWLMEQGIEVVVPDFLTFFLAWFVSANVRVQGEHGAPGHRLAGLQPAGRAGAGRCWTRPKRS